MRVAAAVIVDIAVGEGAVRNGYLTVVGGYELGVNYVYLRHPAEIALRLDELTYLERLERQKHDTSGKILHGSAHGHADSHAAGSQQSSYGSGVDSQGPNHRQDEDYPQGGCHQALDKR